ncbi:hypothetical protein EDB82DRAFT_476527 [Fusarium venenatum]|uniref:uncharacterized protein n=1 Tax=Fusarium venenatum TaxID=56646 RepID=UPI001DD90454|nr:hypothetical protein EDB82DRAFT_476527 [Fusarium venenatum]
MFPKGVFIRDLDLIEEFYNKVPSRQKIIVKGICYTWEARGLDDFRHLRNKRYRTYSGVYYFGEFLLQGQTNMTGHSSTAEAVVKSREWFYMDIEPEAISASEFVEAAKIALNFRIVWFLPMLANLLALRPRAAQDPGILDQISGLFSGRLVEDKSAYTLLRSLKETAGALSDLNCPTVGNQYIIQRFATSSRTTGASRLLELNSAKSHYIRTSRRIVGLAFKEDAGEIMQLAAIALADKTYYGAFKQEAE